MKDGIFVNKSSLHEKLHGRTQGTLNLSRTCTLNFDANEIGNEV